jgi:hypothetical protein
MKATGGDVSKVVNFFGDKEARRGIVALMQNIEQYREMRDRYNAINAPDKLNSDFDMRKDGSGNSFRTFADRWQAMQTAVGQGVNTYLKPAVDTMGSLLDIVTRLAEKVPQLTGAITILGATLGALAVSASVGSMIKGLGGMIGGGAAAATGGAAAGEAAAGVAAGGGLLALGRRWVGRLGLPALAGYLTAEGLQAADPKGNLGGATSGIDAWVLKNLGFHPSKAGDDPNSFQALLRKHFSQSVPSLDKPFDATKQKVLDLQQGIQGLGLMNVTPNVDSSSITDALSKAQALKMSLQGIGAPSLMGNAAPRQATAAGGRTASAGPSNIHVTGYSPGAVASRVAREQDRRIANAQAGALHDTWSLA